MIVVTGTKRSGTSLWMRMLIEGGLTHISDQFPGVWGESIREANPEGFHESHLRRGVFFATNPHPKTGAYITSRGSTHLAVKIFIPGVVRSERAYLHRVIASMRHWRVYARSMADLKAQEDAYYLEHPKDGLTGAQTVDQLGKKRSPIPDSIDWFLENYELVRDFNVRRYPINFSTYDRLLESPDATLERVFTWLGQGDRDKARAVIRPDLNRSTTRDPVPDEDAPSDKHARLFDDFYGAIHETSSIPRTLVPELNTAWQELTEHWARPDSRRVADNTVGHDDEGLRSAE